MVQYAVNVADLTQGNVFVIGILLGEVCSNQVKVEAEKGQLDGYALLLECEEERAKAVCEVLRRAFKRQGLRKPRVYESKTGTGWKKVGS